MRRRDGMPPPELPRDAPILDIPEEMEIRLLPFGRENLDLATLDRRNGGLRERLHLHEPLGRDDRLDDGARALRARQRHLMFLRAAREAKLLKAFLHALPRFKTIEAGELTAMLVEGPIFIEDIERSEERRVGKERRARGWRVQ